VSGLIASAGSAWSYGGSILTFVFPMLLFIGVAVGLYLWYTKPEIVPGHRTPSAERPVSYTAIPGNPAATEVPGNPASAAGDPAADDGTSADEAGNAEPEGEA
jgi:hypothetical protein